MSNVATINVDDSLNEIRKKFNLNQYRLGTDNDLSPLLTYRKVYIEDGKSIPSSFLIGSVLTGSVSGANGIIQGFDGENGGIIVRYVSGEYIDSFSPKYVLAVDDFTDLEVGDTLIGSQSKSSATIYSKLTSNRVVVFNSTGLFIENETLKKSTEIGYNYTVRGFVSSPIELGEFVYTTDQSDSVRVKRYTSDFVNNLNDIISNGILNQNVSGWTFSRDTDSSKIIAGPKKIQLTVPVGSLNIGDVVKQQVSEGNFVQGEVNGVGDGVVNITITLDFNGESFQVTGVEYPGQLLNESNNEIGSITDVTFITEDPFIEWAGTEWSLKDDAGNPAVIRTGLIYATGIEATGAESVFTIGDSLAVSGDISTSTGNVIAEGIQTLSINRPFDSIDGIVEISNSKLWSPEIISPTIDNPTITNLQSLILSPTSEISGGRMELTQISNCTLNNCNLVNTIIGASIIIDTLRGSILDFSCESIKLTKITPIPSNLYSTFAWNTDFSNEFDTDGDLSILKVYESSGELDFVTLRTINFNEVVGSSADWLQNRLISVVNDSRVPVRVVLDTNTPNPDVAARFKKSFDLVREGDSVTFIISYDNGITVLNKPEVFEITYRNFNSDTICVISTADELIRLGQNVEQVQLIPAESFGLGKLTIKNTSGQPVTILRHPTNVDTIDGQTTQPLPANASIQLFSDRSNWWII